MADLRQRVRPTLQCVRQDLQLAVGPTDDPLDEIDHPLLAKANKQFADPGTPHERIAAIDDQVLFKVKVQRWRGAIWSDTPDAPVRDWLVAAGRREAGSTTDFYGDIIVVTELARLGRSLLDLIGIVNDLGARDIGFRSLKENIDTTTPAGTLIFHIMGALAQFERDCINQRAAEGREAAKRRGQTGGRPKADPTKVTAAKELVAAGMSASAAVKATGISRATLYRHGIGTVTAQ